MKISKFLILILFSISCFGFGISAQEVEQGFVGPGGCTTKEDCRAYCDEDSHKEECLTFAVENGMMTQEEADRARKFLNQTGPGGCRGDECKEYCNDPANTEECIRFAEENGLIAPGEGKRFRKMREIEQQGGPGGCRGEECREYCEDEAHRDECFTFARENGLLTEEQIEGYQTGERINQRINEVGGPGGCRSERECHRYCSDPSHIEECVAFGAEQTGKSPEEIRAMLEQFNRDGGRPRSGPEGFERDRENFEMRRQEFEERARRMREEFEGRAMERDAEFQERFQREFTGQQTFPGQQEFPGQGQFQGPGGCNSPESCRAYCMNNPEACGYMGRPEGGGEFRSMPTDLSPVEPTALNHFLQQLLAAPINALLLLQ